MSRPTRSIRAARWSRRISRASVSPRPDRAGSVLGGHDRVEQRRPAGAARPRDDGGGLGRVRRDQHRRLHVRVEADRRGSRSLLPARVLSGGSERQGIPRAGREDRRSSRLEAALPPRLHARRPAARRRRRRPIRSWRCRPASCRRPICRCGSRRFRCPASRGRRASCSRSKSRRRAAICRRRTGRCATR